MNYIQINQCDGCQAGYPVVNGVHQVPYPSGPIGCTKNRYMDKVFIKDSQDEHRLPLLKKVLDYLTQQKTMPTSDKIPPTAEEYFLSKLNPDATGGLEEISLEYAIEIAIEFAKLHLTEQKRTILTIMEIRGSSRIDRNVVSNAYSLSNVK